jgi:hypothetical protein
MEVYVPEREVFLPRTVLSLLNVPLYRRRVVLVEAASPAEPAPVRRRKTQRGRDRFMVNLRGKRIVELSVPPSKREAKGSRFVRRGRVVGW